MSERFSLSALLSQALVAFVIELDNTFEERMPHRAARLGLRGGPPDAPLPAEIETRWETRFGADTMRALHAALGDLVRRLSPDLPDFPPILGYGLTARREPPAGAATEVVSELPLFALLSRPLVAFADEFDAASPVSVAMTVDVLRPIDEAGVAVRELPRLDGS